MTAARTFPSRIGRFEMRGVLGTGTSGTVYRVFDPRLSREVALKVARPGSLETPRDVERFLNEARVVASLRHPHIVAVYDAGQIDGQHYLAASLVNGQSFARALAEGRLDLEQQVRIVREVADALAYAHRKKLIHRDVKPANVLLDTQDKAYLSDFGVARRTEATEKLTHDGEMLGTPAYMAPEHVQSSKDAEPASDQYSLGVILYECLCGQRPFSGDAATVLYSIVHKEPPRPRRIAGTVPLDLERICLKAMAKRPEDRYTSCKDLADDLRRWVGGEPVLVRRPGLLERGRRWMKREPLLASFCAVAFLALLALLLVPVVSYIQLAAAFHARDEALQKARLAALIARGATEQALEEEKRAEDATREAKEATAALDAQTRLAEKAKKEEEEAVEDARKNVARLEARRDLLPPLQYAADVLRAASDFEGGRDDKVKALLDAHRPRDEQPDFRGFEWWQLRQLRHPAEANLPVIGPRESAFDLKSLLACPQQLSLLTARGHLLNLPWDILDNPLPARIQLKPADHSVLDRTLLTDGRYAFAYPYGNGEQVSLVVCLGGPRGEPAEPRLSWNSPGSLELRDPKLRIPASAAAFSRDGKRLLSFHGQPFDMDCLWLWNLQSRKPVQRFATNEPVQVLRLSPGGDLAVSVTRKLPHVLQVWSDTAKEPPRSLEGHTFSILDLEFSPDGKYLASLSRKEIILWELAGNRYSTSKFARDSAAGVFLFSPDSKTLLFATDSLKLVDSHTGRERMTIPVPEPGPHRAAFSPDSQTVAVLSAQDRTLQLWPAGRGGGEFNILLGRGDASAVSYSADGKSIFVIFKDGAVRSYPAAGNAPELLGRRGAAVSSLAFHKGTLRVAAGDELAFWDVTTGAKGETRRSRRSVLPLLCSSGDAARLAIAEEGGTLHVVQKGMAPDTWNMSTARARGLAFSPDGSQLAVAQGDGKLLVMRANPDDQPVLLDPRGYVPNLLALSEGGARLATANEVWLKVWDVAKQQQLAGISALKGVSCLAVSRDGLTVAAGMGEKLGAWDATTGRELFEPLRAHPKDVKVVLLSPDGRTIVTGGADGTVRLWQRRTGQELLMLEPGIGAVTALAFDETGTILAAGGVDGRVRLWHAPREK